MMGKRLTAKQAFEQGYISAQAYTRRIKAMYLVVGNSISLVR